MTVTEQDVRLLLREAAGSYDVPDGGGEAVLAAARTGPAVVPLHRRRWPRVAAAAAAVAGVLVASVALSGPSGQPTPTALPASSPSAATSAAASAVRSPAPSALASPGADAARSRSLSGLSGAGELGNTTAQEALRAPAASASPAPAAPAPGAVAAPAPDGSLGRVVKSGEVSLVARDGRVSATLDGVQRAAQRLGGIVAGSTTDEAGATPSGTVTVRVPVARFEPLVLEVRRLGTVRSARTTARDITAQYADTEAQIRTLRAARERFLQILEQADEIGEILSVQQRVDDVTGKIDRLEGSRRVLAAQSDLSTLTVRVSEADDPAVAPEPEESDTGLSKAFGDGRDGFVSGIEALVAGSGRALLVLLCLGALAVAARLAWRAGRRRLV